MRWELRPDWLTLTGRYEGVPSVGTFPDNHSDAMPIAIGVRDTIASSLGVYPDAVWKDIKPPAFYKYAWQSSDGIMAAFGGQKQGYMVQLHGKWWEGDVASPAAVDAAMKTLGLTATRFDIALTVERVGEWEDMTADLFSSFVDFAKATQARRKPIKSVPYSKHDDYRTFYYGSRKSAKFCRIYDKDYFADSSHTDTRVEMEYKKDMASVMWTLWSAGDAEAVFGDMSHFLFGSATSEGNPLAWVWGVPAERVSAPSRKSEPSARQGWFNGVVLAAFKKWLEEEPGAAALWLWAAQKIWDEKFAHLDV